MAPHPLNLSDPDPRPDTIPDPTPPSPFLVLLCPCLVLVTLTLIVTAFVLFFNLPPFLPPPRPLPPQMLNPNRSFSSGSDPHPDPTPEADRVCKLIDDLFASDRNMEAVLDEIAVDLTPGIAVQLEVEQKPNFHSRKVKTSQMCCFGFC